MVLDSAHIVQWMHWMSWWPMIVCMVHIICGTHMVHDSTQSTHHFDDEWWVPRTKRQQDSGGSHPFKSIRVLAANKMSFHLHTCGRIRNECDLMISLLLFLESVCQDLGVEWPISTNLVLCSCTNKELFFLRDLENQALLITAKSNGHWFSILQLTRNVQPQFGVDMVSVVFTFDQCSLNWIKNQYRNAR